MSYRELRNFTEMMRSLGYPRAISMEAFRTPNFVLVYECLSWLVNKYDPLADIPGDISTPDDRIIFLKSVAMTMYTRARVKLNTKRLYQADGYAVKELLKIATILYDAMQIQKDDTPEEVPQSFRDTAKLEVDVKRTRELASEITSLGATLFDLLGAEEELREARLSALSQQLDVQQMEKVVKRQIADLKENTEKVKTRLSNLGTDEDSLAKQLERKKAELARDEKRLKNMASVRPAFMDEYERLEGSLRTRYDAYVERFRNLEYLEFQLSQYNVEEQRKLEESEAKLQQLRQRIKKEDLEMLRGDADMGNVEEDDQDQFHDDDGPELTGTFEQKNSGNERARARSARRREGSTQYSSAPQEPAARPTVSGSMNAPDDDTTSDTSSFVEPPNESDEDF